MSYTINLNANQVNILIKHYSTINNNCTILPPTNNYTLFRAKFNSSFLTIYRTNTLLIQGKDDFSVYKDVCTLLDISVEKTEETLKTPIDNFLEFKNIIGTDEVGTGDFFGGIIVAAAFVTKDDISFLKKLGVKDSKEISDYKIAEIAPTIISNIPTTYSKIDCLHYNYLIQKHKLNMNSIKALMHNSVINSIKHKVTNYDAIIIDAFTTRANYFSYLKNEKNVSEDVILEEKAENKYFAVACASIIARYKLIKDFEALSSKMGFEIPKGAGKNVDTAILKIYNEHGISIFKDIAKLNFKNLTKVIKN